MQTPLIVIYKTNCIKVVFEKDECFIHMLWLLFFRGLIRKTLKYVLRKDIFGLVLLFLIFFFNKFFSKENDDEFDDYLILILNMSIVTVINGTDRTEAVKVSL